MTMQTSMARSRITRLIFSNTTSLRLNRITNHRPWTTISKTYMAASTIV
jgi:hypothetical protein